MRPIRLTGLALVTLVIAACASVASRDTADLGVVVERATGSVQLVNQTKRVSVGRIQGLGETIHAL